jgi:signal transduction histidine kinase
MTRPTLRLRLIAAAAAATLSAVAALGVTVLLLVDHQLHSSLDDTLRARAADVARLAASAPALLTAPSALEAPFGGRQLSVEVLDRQGRIYARSLSHGGRVLPGGTALRAALAGARSDYRDARLSREPIRLFAAPLAEAGGPVSGGAVLVASSTSEIDDTLRELRTLVVLSALAAAALGALLAALLTQRGLRPLRRLVDGAREITRRGEGRLPQAATHDELAELSAALNRMLEALERARETERRFLADASHELRTPLTSLRGNAAYIAEHGADAAALRDIEADAARLSRLLDDLLALEREEAASHPRDELRLSELVHEVTAGDADLTVEIAGDASVLGEHGALERALRNLIENARVHGPEGGPIEVSLRLAGDRARLTVSDAGHGLDAEQAKHAVQRFWRAPEASQRPGSGLGLAIVASTAARHSGSLLIDGPRFTLDLPVLRTFSKPAPTVR